MSRWYRTGVIIIMKKYITAMMAMIAMSMMLLSSCGKESESSTPAEPPVGVWKLGDTHICKFRANGTYIRMWYDLGEFGEVTGIWKLDPSKTQMTMIEDYETTLWLVQSMDENSFTLVNTNTAYAVTYIKAEDKTDQIVGTWKCTKARVVDAVNGSRDYSDTGWTLSVEKDGDIVYVGDYIFPRHEVLEYWGGNRLVVRGYYEIYPRRYEEYTLEKQ